MSKIVIVTDTLYREFDNISSEDHLRGQLALESARMARGAGLTMVVVDAGSCKTFRKQLTRAGARVFDQNECGKSSGRRQGYKIAFEEMDANVCVRMEAEKFQFIDPPWLEKAAASILNGAVDIIVPARNARGFNSLPSAQRMIEVQGNEEYCCTLHKEGLLESKVNLDVFFGPRIFGRETYRFFLRSHAVKVAKPDCMLHPNNYSDALFFPLVYALKANCRVHSMESQYVHPRARTMFEIGSTMHANRRMFKKEMILAEHREIIKVVQGEKSNLQCISNLRMFV